MRRTTGKKQGTPKLFSTVSTFNKTKPKKTPKKIKTHPNHQTQTSMK